MQNRVLICAMLLAATFLGGCTQQCSEPPGRYTGGTPTPEELPPLDLFPTETNQVTVAVEGRPHTEPKRTLVPDLAEPPLTPEEQAVLKEEDADLFQPLLFTEVARNPELPVTNSYAGPAVYAAGDAGAAVWSEGFPKLSRVGLSYGGVSMGYSMRVAVPGATYNPSSPSGASYFDSAGVQIGYDRSNDQRGGRMNTVDR